MENKNNVKFKELIKYLKTVPVVDPTEEEKVIMDSFDNDIEEQLKVKKFIKNRENEKIL